MLGLFEMEGGFRANLVSWIARCLRLCLTSGSDASEAVLMSLLEMNAFFAGC